MARIVRHHFLRLALISLTGIALFSLAQFAYAQTGTGSHAHAPEPGSLALMSMGVIGWLIRFARRSFARFKRGFDICLGLIGMVLTAPFLAATALFIKIVSPGPVFYKQERVGYLGRHFTIYKLRTMRADAEKMSGPTWAKEKDPRLITGGYLIRKLRFDEIPQLYNVLRGDMSIIGPRPERPYFVKQFNEKISDYRKRLYVKPGITGMAQVYHKYDEDLSDVRKKVKYDLLYIKKMSLWTDLGILMRTAMVVATGAGAR